MAEGVQGSTKMLSQSCTCLSTEHLQDCIPRNGKHGCAAATCSDRSFASLLTSGHDFRYSMQTLELQSNDHDSTIVITGTNNGDSINY